MLNAKYFIGGQGEQLFAQQNPNAMGMRGLPRISSGLTHLNRNSMGSETLPTLIVLSLISHLNRPLKKMV